jgi:hypothetical protein
MRSMIEIDKWSNLHYCIIAFGIIHLVNKYIYMYLNKC